MEVIVQSILQNEVQGRVKVACDPNDTIDSLISTFCIEKGIRQKKEYVLKTRDTDILHNTRKISTCGIKTGDTLYLGTPASDEETFGCSNWWILAAVSLIIGSIGLIAISVLKVVGDVIPDEYGIVIDAGSSRTSLFVYHWKGEKENGTGIVRQIGNCRSTAHPFAEYEANPNDAGQTLGNCVEVAKQKIPKHEWSNSLIWFGATAGMRMLRERNNATSNKMMKVVQNTLSKTPFKFSNPTQQAVILSGGQEGAFAWVTVNYLIGSFGKLVKSKSATTNILLPNKDGETSGSLEMGGASSQITFVPESSTKIPQSYSEKLSLFGKRYEVFAESFLCYGKGEAEKRLLANLLQEKNLPNRLENPCGPKGLIINYTYSYLFEAPCVKGIHALRTYGSEIITDKDIAPNTTYTFEGTGNAAKCYNNTKKMFNFSSCTYDHCSFNGQYMPKVKGSFLALSGYWYTMNFLNLTSTPLSIGMLKTAVDNLCGKTWAEVKTMPNGKKSKLPFYCFDGQFVYTTIVDGFHFNNDTFKDIRFVQKIDETNVGWPVGLMLNVTNSIPTEMNPNKVNIIVFVLLMLLFIIFIILAIGFACHAKHQQDTENRYRRLSNVQGYGSM